MGAAADREAASCRAPDNDTFRRTVVDVGFQLTVVHRLPMTFSIGFASAYENGDKLDDEWLFSLKIL